MGFIRINENPQGLRVGDCVIRAIALITKKDWYDVYIDLSVKGMQMADTLDSNRVWMTYLKEQGFKIKTLVDSCPDCYSILDFCADYPSGEYLVATGNHLVAVIDGNFYDTWDSSNEAPIYYFYKEV